jgi:hypothetical protein
MTSGLVKEGNQMIITRKLGHKQEMPGSGQWQIQDDGEDKCWCCDNHIYAMVFWSLDYGWEQPDDVGAFQEENLIS